MTQTKMDIQTSTHEYYTRCKVVSMLSSEVQTWLPGLRNPPPAAATRMAWMRGGNSRWRGWEGVRNQRRIEQKRRVLLKLTIMTTWWLPLHRGGRSQFIVRGGWGASLWASWWFQWHQRMALVGELQPRHHQGSNSHNIIALSNNLSEQE